MRITIEISDDKIINFSSSAKSELKTHIHRLAEEIVDEASRIEASRRISDTSSEVTQSNVKEAATQPRMTFTKKKGWKFKVIQGVASISTLITGGLFDIDKFQDTTRIVWFLITFFFATATTVYVIFNQDNNG